MINVELLQLTQTSLIVLLIAAIGVIRERSVLPFLIVILGAFLKGEVAAVLVASLVVLVRFEAGAPRWLRFKDAVSVFCLIAGTAINSPYKEFALSLGVLGLAYHNQNDRLGVIPTLLLLHLYFESLMFPEVVLGVAAFFVVVKELLELAKVGQRKKILQWVEVPVLLAILIPIQTFLQVWIEDQTLLILAGSIAAILIFVILWVKIKKPDFDVIYTKLQGFGSRWINSPSRLFSGNQLWLSDRAPEVRFSVESGFDAYFWPVAIAGIAWLAAVLITRGGLG